MTEAVHKYTKVGGPLPKAILDKYPGDEEFIKYLEKEYNFKWRTGEIKKSSLM